MSVSDRQRHASEQMWQRALLDRARNAHSGDLVRWSGSCDLPANDEWPRDREVWDGVVPTALATHPDPGRWDVLEAACRASLNGCGPGWCTNLLA